jgi:hypothetical protein
MMDREQAFLLLIVVACLAVALLTAFIVMDGNLIPRVPQQAPRLSGR